LNSARRRHDRRPRKSPAISATISSPPAATKTPRPVMTPATTMESTAVEPAAVEPAQHRSHCRLTTRYQRVIGQHEVERATIATLSDLIVIAHRVHEEDVSGINAYLIDIGSKPLARRKQRRRSGTVAGRAKSRFSASPAAVFSMKRPRRYLRRPLKRMEWGRRSDPPGHRLPAGSRAFRPRVCGSCVYPTSMPI
jgi:hypothetical protein